MQEERAPFTSEDPRETGTGDQLPEENPEGQGADRSQQQDPQSGESRPGARDPSRRVESDPRKATGNPGAAG